MKKNVKIGCCGFPISRKKYYEKFKVVELQQTFYQIPDENTVWRWREESPKDFEFTLKAFQLITHPPSSPTYRKLKMKIDERKIENYGFFKPTDEVFKAWELTEKTARILKSKIVIFQCPASFKQNDLNIKNMEKFFNSIKRENFIFGWELRGKWDKKIIKEICENLNLIHVVDPFENESVYGVLKYWRLHGIGSYRYKFEDKDFLFLKEKIDKEKIDEIYIMFNNVYMDKDASAFKKIIDEK